MIVQDRHVQVYVVIPTDIKVRLYRVLIYLCNLLNVVNFCNYNVTLIDCILIPYKFLLEMYGLPVEVIRIGKAEILMWIEAYQTRPLYTIQTLIHTPWNNELIWLIRYKGHWEFYYVFVIVMIFITVIYLHLSFKNSYQL